jgi:hypothetical protein
MTDRPGGLNGVGEGLGITAATPAVVGDLDLFADSVLESPNGVGGETAFGEGD